jgi:hypothetical protein
MYSLPISPSLSVSTSYPLWIQHAGGYLVNREYVVMLTVKTILVYSTHTLLRFVRDSRGTRYKREQMNTEKITHCVPCSLLVGITPLLQKVRHLFGVLQTFFTATMIIRKNKRKNIIILCGSDQVRHTNIIEEFAVRIQNPIRNANLHFHRSLLLSYSHKVCTAASSK